MFEYSCLLNFSFTNKVKLLVKVAKFEKQIFDLYSDCWTVSEISPDGQMQHKNKIPEIRRTHMPRMFNFISKYSDWQKMRFLTGLPY